MEPNFAQIRKMLEARLLARVLEDPAFHERLLKDPRAAFQEELGIPFPAAAKLQVIEEPADTLILVVPPAPRPGGELSDAQLDAAAGGLLDEIWSTVKGWIGGKKFEVSTERAVAGVRG